ncbi:hypothetical protein K458DRAFT_478168 [Lentithecium fluviatile CBS 122367]|uniref:SAM-dependent MTase RsmB/NOP-type domain-containing protein n=1 Tax=Lentithecium fluviatile CBS 122367 TaxID=1168545 RepID=A0A6G1J0Z6_9PLEO|nr:hypothetical protein K458DRAFT_478168 [Lentithecium fluviatile CBS 122367]
MSLYYEAASVLVNTSNAGGSLKSRIYNNKELRSAPAQLFALISEASKWSVVLKGVIERCGVLGAEKKLTPILGLLLTHDLVVSKGGVAAPAGHVLKLAIQRHKARLSAEFTKERIRRGYATLEAFKQAVNEGELKDGGKDTLKGGRRPRWVRVNTLKTTLEKQLLATFVGYSKADDIGAVLSASGLARIYFEDPNIPNLLALPPRIDLSKTAAYTSGSIILQDKASCFPAYLLDVKPDDGDVIDGCAAPGNKTTQLAAIVSEGKTASKHQKVIAFERDKTRAVTLKKMVGLASADQFVKIKAGADFLATNPDSEEFANVRAILLDPSCSGSGIIGRDDAIRVHLPDASGEAVPSSNGSKSRKRKRGYGKIDAPAEKATLDLTLEDSSPEETPIEDKVSERLAALSTFQLRILTHAMRFPKARKITYSTCSIHFEENEGVVARALASPIAKEVGWSILRRENQVEGLKNWDRRGVWEAEKLGEGVEFNKGQEEEICESCIRCEKGTDEGTMGFFVAAFVRHGTLAQGTVSLGREDVVEGEEWNGFSDGDDEVATDISRPHLRQIAYWIRDELDPIIAREGPEHLRVDDVLILHDIFQALRTSSSITALDLRATGIHKAVLDVSGLATRWPGRLCDDCDKIISIWTAKFGRLEDLHPFLYGRGGRLEGIASVEGSSKQALIKRWQITCPDRIAPKRSHRHGDLGFRAGEWWINPLFACHAGIIDIDSVEGGICYDKNGAYAMLLKNTGEIEASAETNFKYRCGRNDKGRFRLTAATPKSRQPIRVLRSHSINSIWGPKAGVRYEGLYNVVGWTVHQVKTTDISGDEYRAGDIVYDVHLLRDDPVLMEEVVKIPTTFQVDEYTEYKRLRKLYREMLRKGEHGHTGKPEAQPVPAAKIAPPIAPLALPISLPRTQPKISPSRSRTTTFKRPVAEILTKSPARKAGTVGLPAALVEDEELFRGPRKSMLGVPAQTTTRPTTQNSKSESPVSDRKSHPTTLKTRRSNASSNPSHTSDIREVAPWVDFELEFYAPPSSPPPPAVDHEAVQRVSRNSTRTVYPSARNSPSPMRQKRQSDEERRTNIVPPTSLGWGLRKKDSRKSIFVRSRNPMAKLFDGAEDVERSGGDYFSFRRRANSVAPKRTSPMARQRGRASSSHETPLSPVPLRPISPNNPLLSPLLMGRRDAICLPYGYVLSPSTPAIDLHEHTSPRAPSTENVSKDASSPRSGPLIPLSLPVSLHSLISKSKPISALTTPTSSPRSSQKGGEMQGVETDKVDNFAAVDELKRFIEGVGEDVKVVFRDPFREEGGERVITRESSGDVAPDVVV